jgi:hypothetical protein
MDEYTAIRQISGLGTYRWIIRDPDGDHYVVRKAGTLYGDYAVFDTETEAQQIVDPLNYGLRADSWIDVTD